MTKSDRQQRDMMATEMANIHADLTRLSERRNSVSYVCIEIFISVILQNTDKLRVLDDMTCFQSKWQA